MASFCISCEKDPYADLGYDDGEISVAFNGNVRSAAAKTGKSGRDDIYSATFLFPERSGEGDFSLLFRVHRKTVIEGGQLNFTEDCQYSSPSCSTAALFQDDSGPLSDLLLSMYMPDSTYENKLIIVADGRGKLTGSLEGRFIRPVATDPVLTRYPDTILVTNGRFDVQFEWPLP